MASFSFQPRQSTPIDVSLPTGLSRSQLESFRPWNDWIQTISHSLSLQTSPSHPFHSCPYSLRSVTIQSYDLFSSSRLGFVKLTADVSNSAGERLPSAALLRGPSVAMLVMLIPEDTPPDSDERYVVLTVQPRVPAGSLGFVELPAGMVDDMGSFKGAAAKEMEEELGVAFHESELTCLSDVAASSSSTASGTTEDQAAQASAEKLANAMYPSAGGCDEHVTLFSAERRIPRSQLEEWNGRLTGLRDHGEKITLKIVPMKDLWREASRDAKALGALAIWEGARRANML